MVNNGKRIRQFRNYILIIEKVSINFFFPIFHEFVSFKYLRSVRPLLDDENYARMEKLATEFETGIGSKLQRYLILKSWWATNYVSDWWEEYVYLRGRSPIMVNSNFYGIDAILMHPTKVQTARAASIIHSCLQYRRLIERQELEPVRESLMNFTLFAAILIFFSLNNKNKQ